jgi:DNA-binding response OmpR family regulator
MSGQERSIQGPAGRLLIVDDVDVNRDLLARRVARLGHTVDEAEDGEGGLAKLAAAAANGQPYDVVFLDVMMPGLSGYDVLERIMTSDALSHTRVIMVSADDEIDSVVRCIDLGADDYLTKPFNPVLLEARLTSSLARKQVADAQRFYADAMEHELEVGREIQAGFFRMTCQRLTAGMSRLISRAHVRSLATSMTCLSFPLTSSRLSLAMSATRGLALRSTWRCSGPCFGPERSTRRR